MAIAVGDAEILELHLNSLAAAPYGDLLKFKEDGGHIYFARSFTEAASSSQANRSRGRPLDADERRQFEGYDDLPGHVFGLYDFEMRGLIFTPRDEPKDHERVTFHELGHAVTWPGAHRAAHLRGDLLKDLPEPIALMLRGYPSGFDRPAIRTRVLEVLAEGYVWLLSGRERELPQDVIRAIQGLLAGESLPLRP